MTVLIGEAGSGSQAGAAASAEAAKANGVSAPGALKPMPIPKPEKVVGEPHPIDIEFKDAAGKYLKGLDISLLDPSGIRHHSASNADGKYHNSSYAKAGSYKASLLSVSEAKCDKAKLKGGDSCTISAKATGYADGTVAFVYISLVDAEGKAEAYDRARERCRARR